MRTRLILASASAVGLFVAAAIVGAPIRADAETGLSRPDLTGAEDAAARCAGRAVTLKNPVHMPATQENVVDFVDELSGDHFWIDVSRGDVQYWRPARAPRASTSRTRLTDSDAIQAARGVATRMTPSLSTDQKEQVQHRTDDVRDETVVTISEYVQGVRTQNGLRVVLDASTGNVLSATAHDTPTTVSLSPRIGRTQAVLLAERAAGIPIHTDEYAELRVIESWDRPQSLVWWVELATGDEGFGGVRTVLIDAQSSGIVETLSGSENLSR